MAGHMQGCSSSVPHPVQFSGCPNIPLMCTRCFFAVCEVAEHEAAHLSLLMFKVKSGWSFTSVYLNAVEIASNYVFSRRCCLWGLYTV